MKRSCIIALLSALVAPSAEAAEDPLREWKRQAAAGSEAWAFLRQKDGSLRVEIRDGDCSDDRKTPECETGRERAELVDPDTPWRRTPNWYGYSLHVPAEIPQLPVHVTMGQWWSPDFTFAFREVKGLFEFAVYTSAQTAPVKICRIDSTIAVRGKWVRFVLSATYGPGSIRTVVAYANAEQVCRWQDEAPTTAARLPVWKIGLYRPTIGTLPRPHPTQWIFYKDVKKGSHRADVE